jgi:hypothetical protein
MQAKLCKYCVRVSANILFACNVREQDVRTTDLQKRDALV